jgi:alanine dehydrogenase
MEQLREEEFKGLFGMGDFLYACHRAFELYGKGEIDNPPRSELVEKRGELDYFRLDMPAEWPGKYRSRKIIEEFSDVAEGRLAKREAYIELEDLQRGEELRLDAGYITDMRTGAAGALGIKYLAGEGVKRVAILGTGRISRNLALACDGIFALDEIRCTSRKAENRAAFAEEVGPELRASLQMEESIEACLEGVEAVLTAVPTPQPILTAEAVAGIEYLAVMAGDGRTRQVAPEVLAARGVVVDVLAQAQKSGEFRYAEEAGDVDAIRLARNEDGEVLHIGDAACGRLGAEAPKIAYLTGMGAQDLCAAAMVYERLAPT